MDAVDRAFRMAPREEFLPVGQRPHAALDRPLPLGCGATSSQPTTVATMLRLLDVQPGMRVLDVGAGSGWTTALLAELTGATGLVVGVEIEPAIASFGAANLDRHGRPWARLELADPAVLGAPADAPYDRVLVSADAPRVPASLLAQLTPDGVLLVPVRGEMTRVRLVVDGEPRITTHGRYTFVPLR